ncbi:PA4642 family protein [Alloalcanivorax sp. C16-2]|uniref:PA4642 family protein n=1 Tax=Alloalcanivorax TaxID=3020832 RepID=UPI001933B63B|nr:PA4642 family protein [Alloalcanivorax marinus]MBL7250001.1 PA4642 family protein [Alloalcanivorax marinus]
MAERKDKQKVIGEPMTDEQIKVFLDFPPEDGENPDFHVLLKAYRALRVEDFERFVAFFQEQGRDLRATDTQGRTLLDIVRGHGKSEPFVAILERAGA